jgi:hypothetical protein
MSVMMVRVFRKNRVAFRRREQALQRFQPLP